MSAATDVGRCRVKEDNGFASVELVEDGVISFVAKVDTVCIGLSVEGEQYSKALNENALPKRSRPLHICQERDRSQQGRLRRRAEEEKQRGRIV